MFSLVANYTIISHRVNTEERNEEEKNAVAFILGIIEALARMDTI